MTQTDHDSERVARAGLSLLTEPGDTRVANVVANVGAKALYERLAGDPALGQIWADARGRAEVSDPEAVLAVAARKDIRFVIPGDSEWLPALDDLGWSGSVSGLGGPPLGLWVRGPVRLVDIGGAVSLVGSRSATSYGTQVAGQIASEIAVSNRVVVSGAAFGIDSAAHRAALASRGCTVAVLACGVDHAYPAAHGDLLAALAREHAVISELPPGCTPTRVRFLGRNRLIAALSTGVVVVEAAVRSGALNTATWANRLNRPLFGVPGPVTSAPSAGVHGLIREGRAELVTEASHVLDSLAPLGQAAGDPVRGNDRPWDGLPLQMRRVLDACNISRGSDVEVIARKAGLAPSTVAAALSGLFEKGLVAGEGEATAGADALPHRLWRVTRRGSASWA